MYAIERLLTTLSCTIRIVLMIFKFHYSLLTHFFSLSLSLYQNVICMLNLLEKLIYVLTSYWKLYMYVRLRISYEIIFNWNSLIFLNSREQITVKIIIRMSYWCLIKITNWNKFLWYLLTLALIQHIVDSCFSSDEPDNS